MHIIVSCLHIPIQAVKEHYKEQRALAGPDQLVQFQGNEIRLDLPMREVEVNKWIILPLIEPVVSYCNYKKKGWQIKKKTKKQKNTHTRVYSRDGI